MTIYDFEVKDITGKQTSMSDYKNKVILIVNTASKCGFTPQFEELQKLYENYHAQGFEILGFPCNQFKEQEKGTHSEIQEFCKLNYGVTFKMFGKIDVNGEHADPLYTYLKSQQKGLFKSDIKWNFTKFLVDSNGNVIKRYSPLTKPLSIEKDIQALL